MAEPAGNGNSLKLQHGSTALGLTTKELPFIVVLILVGVLGVYRIRTHDTTLQQIATALHDIRADLQGQNNIVANQTAALQQELHAQNEFMRREIEVLRRMLITLNWNMTQELPARLPLELPPPIVTPPERAR